MAIVRLGVLASHGGTNLQAIIDACRLVRAVKAGHTVGKRSNPLLLMAPGYAKLRKVLA